MINLNFRSYYNIILSSFEIMFIIKIKIESINEANSSIIVWEILYIRQIFSKTIILSKSTMKIIIMLYLMI